MHTQILDSTDRSSQVYVQTNLGALGTMVYGQEGHHEVVGMKRLLRLFGFKEDPAPAPSSITKEAMLDMRLRAVQDDLQSIRTDLNARITEVSRAIDEARVS